MSRRILAWLIATLIAVLIVASGQSASADDPNAKSPYPNDTGKMLLVMDSSGSMAEPAPGGIRKIDAGKVALDRVVDTLPDSARVGMRVFGAKDLDRGDPGACTDSKLVVPVAAGNRAELHHAVHDYTPKGETPISYALRQAAKDLGSTGQRSIVLVSDGIATCKPDPCDVAKELAEEGIDLHIDVVGLSVNSAARAQLRCIAAAGDGKYYDAGSADDIVKSITTVSERAIRPFTIDGTPIRGGSSQANAVPVQPGRYADRVGTRGERWYRYNRRYPDSQVLASEYVMRPGLLANTSIDLYASDGETSCRGKSETFWSWIFTGYAQIAGLEGDPDSCGDPTIYIKVSSTADKQREFGLTVWEEPRPTNSDELPDPVDSQSRPAFHKPKASPTKTPIVAGSTFADATPVISGRTYSATIVPGEVQAYRIHVGYGQTLSVAVDRPKATDLDRVPLNRSYDLQLLSPLRAGLDDLRLSDLGETQQSVSTPVRQFTGSVPVRWLNRTDTSVSYTAGDYYIVYQADFTAPDSIELPYRITARVDGQESGIPAYPAGETLLTGEQDPPVSPSPTPDRSAAPATVSPPPYGSAASSQHHLAAWIAGTIAVLAAAAGGFIVWRRRR